MILLTLDNNTTPDLCLAQRINFWQQSVNRAADIFALRFVHHAQYLVDQPQQPLIAVVSILPSDSSIAPTVDICIFPCCKDRLRDVESLPANVESLAGYRDEQNLPEVRISSPLLLAPVHIAKPWGQEIWYTGIEARGQAQVVGKGGNLPLPWVMEFLRDRLLMAPSEQLILLKVLDPLADTPYGDLYFELHEQKQEVYVVTHIDEGAWPGGHGVIQLGFDPEVLAQYSTSDAFKAAYRHAVKSYEGIRRAIDAALDQKKLENGVNVLQPVPAARLIRWMEELCQDGEFNVLVETEAQLKTQMERFIARQSLAVGDVVVVPKLVPHALQHGVRVVEFQTPVYERKILSFGQKVLTQKHWDTDAALDLIDLNANLALPPEVIVEAEDIEIHRIVNFEEFEVRRLRFTGSHTLEINRYCLLMILDGDLSLGDEEKNTTLKPGAVALIAPSIHSTRQLSASSTCVLLQAIPKKI